MVSERRVPWKVPGENVVRPGTCRGSILMRMPHRESLQATHRSPLVPLNPSRRNIWPPGLRVVGSVTRRMRAWSRSAPEPHRRAPEDTERLSSSSAFCPEPTHISVRTQGLGEWLQKLSRAQIPQIWEKVTTVAAHPYLGLAAR